ncbi:MAG: nuclear transport factor 2 family protein [Rhodospirillaceae bacterium]|nr:nuclear transport factor 2 family protein [Rhodospirillaceae bacterium]
MSGSQNAIDATARAAIESLLTEFCWRVDHGQAATVAELFIEQGRVITPMFTLEGRAQIAAHFLKRDADKTILSRHQWSNLRLTPDGATRVRADMIVQTHLGQQGPPAAPLGLMIGDSLDVVEKGGDGVWRFVERRLHVAFRDGAPPAHGAKS